MYSKTLLLLSADPPMKGMARNIIASHNERSISCGIPFHGKFDTVIRLWHSDLTSVAWYQELYILAHGKRGSPYMYAEGARSDSDGIHVDEVVANLLARGLTRHIRTIKLLNCHGGSGLENTPALAQHFKTALSRAGYSRTAVYGYASLVHHSKMSAQIVTDENGQSHQTLSRLSGVRVKF